MPSIAALVATPYRRGVVVLAAVTFAWRVWTVARWSWQNDDWQHIERSVTMPFWPYLFHEHSGHVVPGVFLVTDIMTRVAPLDFNAVVSVVALACAANVLVWGRAFERVTRGHILALLPLSIVALSPVFVEPMQWWSASALALPVQISLGLMVIAVCRWTESRHRRDLGWLAVAYVIGLFFWQKSVLLTVPAAFVLVALATGSVRQRLRSVRAPIGLLVVLTVPYLLLLRYLTQRSAASYDIELTLEGRSFSDAVQQYAHGFADMFLPAMLGGPWGSMQVDSDPFSEPAPAVTTAVLVVCAAALAWLARYHWRVLWLLLLPLTYTIVSLGVVLFSTRADDVWDMMTMERYFVDPIVVAMLTGALMIRAARPAGPSASSTVGGRRLRHAAMALVATSLVFSNLVAADRIGTHPGRHWVETLRTDVVRLSEQRTDSSPLVLWDANSPDSVLQPVWWNEAARLSYMLLPFRDTVAFGEATPQMYQVDADGRIVPSQISRMSTSGQGPDRDCGYYVEPGQTVPVPMSAALFSWGWGLEVTAFSATGGDLVVDVGSTDVQVPMPSGQQTRVIQIAGEISETVRVSVPEGSSGAFCINDIHVGEPEPRS